MEPLVVAAGILGVALVSAVAIVVYGRMRLERERTLQRLVDRGLSPDDLARVVGPEARRRLDLTRGVLLVAVAMAWSGVTVAMGGRAWVLGIAPAALGLGYLLVWGLDGRRR